MEAALAWAQAQLERRVRAVDVSHPHGEATVFRLERDREAIAYLKVYPVIDKLRRECAVLKRLATDLRCDVIVPAVLGMSEVHHAILLRVVPGTSADAQPLAPDHDHEVHRMLGVFRAALDAVTVQHHDPMQLSDALQRRYQGWRRRGANTIASSLVSDADRCFDPTVFADATRVWCHRDLDLHNCLIHRPPSSPLRLGIIDFGQARPDIGLGDVVKLLHTRWHDRPERAAAFWSGYGRPLTAIERRQLQGLSLIHGLATAVWGDKHRHARFSEHGRTVLRRTVADSW